MVLMWSRCGVLGAKSVFIFVLFSGRNVHCGSVGHFVHFEKIPLFPTHWGYYFWHSAHHRCSSVSPDFKLSAPILFLRLSQSGVTFYSLASLCFCLQRNWRSMRSPLTPSYCLSSVCFLSDQPFREPELWVLQDCCQKDIAHVCCIIREEAFLSCFFKGRFVSTG